MRWSAWVPILVVGLGIAGSAIALDPRITVAVSPGSADHFALLESRCPTFSWSAVRGATRYELLFSLAAGSPGAEGRAAASERIVDAAATSWTPSLADCFERGGRYGWSVRARSERWTGPWSRTLLFEVAAPPSTASAASADAPPRLPAGVDSSAAAGSPEAGPDGLESSGSGAGRPTAESGRQSSLLAGTLAGGQTASASSSAMPQLLVEGRPVLTAASPMIVPSAAFTSDGVSLGAFFFNGGRLQGQAATGEACLKAVVAFPTGVTLSELAAVVFDEDAEQRIDVSLWRFDKTDTTGGVDTSASPIATVFSRLSPADTAAEEFVVAINSGNGELVEPDDAFFLQTCLRSEDIGLYWVRISFTGP